MIVPRTRLIVWTGIIAIPFSLVAAAVPAACGICAVIIAGFGILVVTDILLSRSRFSSITVQLPEVVRLSKGREGSVTVRIRRKAETVNIVRLGLSFPREVYSLQPELIVQLAPKAPTFAVDWPCKPLKPGKYFIQRCYLEINSALGFWAVQGSVPTHTELRVYPNLAAGRRNLAALFLKKRLGIHTQRQVGKGRDFELLRDYMPGDSFEDIHWKSTAKRRIPVTKVYQVERTQQVYVAIDGSRLSARSAEHLQGGRKPGSERRGSLVTSVLEQYVTASLLLGLAAQQQGDMFGIVTFRDQVSRFIQAKTGKEHFNVCRNTLFTFQPQGVSPDFAELFTFLSTRLRRRALLLILTNLDDPVLAESFVNTVPLVCKRHLIVVNMLKPAQACPLFSSPHVETVNDLYRMLGGHLLWNSLRETEKSLRRYGVGLTLLENELISAQLISKYLSIKQRQML